MGIYSGYGDAATKLNSSGRLDDVSPRKIHIYLGLIYLLERGMGFGYREINYGNHKTLNFLRKFLLFMICGFLPPIVNGNQEMKYHITSSYSYFCCNKPFCVWKYQMILCGQNCWWNDKMSQWRLLFANSQFYSPHSVKYLCQRSGNLSLWPLAHKLHFANDEFTVVLVQIQVVVDDDDELLFVYCQCCSRPTTQQRPNEGSDS